MKLSSLEIDERTMFKKYSWLEKQMLNGSVIYDIITYPQHLLYRIRRRIDKLGRIFRFIPKLWHFEYYDQHFLFKLLSEVVIEYRRNWLDKTKIHIIESSRLRNVKTLTIMANILRRLADEEYDQSPFLQRSYPKMISTPVNDPERPRMGSQVTFRYDDEEAERRSALLYKLSMKQEKQLRIEDVELLCKLLKTKSQQLWD